MKRFFLWLASMVATLAFAVVLFVGQGHCDITSGNKANKELYQRIQLLETSINNKNEELKTSSIEAFNRSGDAANRLIGFVGMVATVYGIIIAIASFYIGFISLRNKSRSEEAIKTLEDAKLHVESKLADVDHIIDVKLSEMKTKIDDMIQLMLVQLSEDVSKATDKINEHKQFVSNLTKEVEESTIGAQAKDQLLLLLERKIKVFDELGLPDDPNLLYSKAMMFKEKGEAALCMDLLNKVVKLVPDHIQAYGQLSLVLYELGYYKDLIDLCDKLLETDTPKGPVHNNKGLALAKLGRHKDAINEYNKGISASPDNHRTYGNKIESLFASGLAAKDVLELIDNDLGARNHSYKVYATIARVLIEHGCLSEGKMFYEKHEEALNNLIEGGDTSEVTYMNYFEALIINDKLFEAVSFGEKIAPVLSKDANILVYNLLSSCLLLFNNEKSRGAQKLLDALKYKEEKNVEMVWTFVDIKPFVEQKLPPDLSLLLNKVFESLENKVTAEHLYGEISSIILVPSSGL